MFVKALVGTRRSSTKARAASSTGSDVSPENPERTVCSDRSCTDSIGTENPVAKKKFAAIHIKKNTLTTVPRSEKFNIINADLVKVDLLRLFGFRFFLNRTGRMGKANLFQKGCAENIRVENVGRENPFGSVCPRVVADNIDMVGKRNLRAGIETLIFGTNAVDLNTVGTSLIENIPIPAGKNQSAMASRNILETENNVIPLGTPNG